ncbi:hypothetical protein LTR50_006798 [Elasticomyces elasticus]|nr:hypothetical protein LTR50_006798 [Elasticomyces elasticus]
MLRTSLEGQNLSPSEDSKRSAEHSSSVQDSSPHSEIHQEYLGGVKPFAQETTPKAQPVLATCSVPSFTLDESYTSRDDDEVEALPAFFPLADSHQRASATPATDETKTHVPPPPNATQEMSIEPSLHAAKSVASSLMPPPRLPQTLSKPSAAASLRVPTTGPLPNRSRPSASVPKKGNLLLPSNTITTPNARNKVLLAPGHSPLDWAHLARTHPNLSGVPCFQRVTPSMLAWHDGRPNREPGALVDAKTGKRARKPAWSAYQGKVYNITPYLPFHPGGEGQLLLAAGKDGGKLFMEAHPWVNWENMLGECVVGIMVSEPADDVEHGASLDNMD